MPRTGLGQMQLAAGVVVLAFILAGTCATWYEAMPRHGVLYEAMPRNGMAP